jgi:uncharacterized protein YwqG
MCYTQVPLIHHIHQTYDRVLLQIDSTRDGNSSIIWGDLGIANILVKSTDLEEVIYFYDSLSCNPMNTCNHQTS